MTVLQSNGNLTRKEAADYLRIGVRTLDNLAQKGEMQYSKLGNGIRVHVVYQRKDLDSHHERIHVDRKLLARKIVEGT
jgi:excisionase family DNA binding protein